MITVIVLAALASLLTTHGQLAYSSLGQSCDKHHDCLPKKCEFDIVATCAFGNCVCDMDASHGNLFIQELKYNIEKYVATHYTTTFLRNKRSMMIVIMNRLSKKVASTITFEESNRNKRSIRRVQSARNRELLHPLQNCADNNTSDHQQMKWVSVANSLRLYPTMEEDAFFRHWNDIIKPFSKDTMKPDEFSHEFPKLPIKDVVSGISTTDVFQRLFWPFIYEFAFMNQKLALLGLTGEEAPSRVQKSTFFAALEKIQAIKIPIVERKITYSFDDTNIADGLIHYDAVADNISANVSIKHMFNTQERKEIIRKTDAALELIAKTMPDLHRAMHQVVGCIAFYKAEDRAHVSGSMNSAIGILWLDPSSSTDWTVPFYAEQIVHEYIHTSLYMAELVHGMFADHQKLPLVKVMSSIRLEKRDYDKSFHACYVSTGLVAFHAKAGFWTRAQLLAETISETIEELIVTNEAHDILTPAGKATLDSMKHFAKVIRLIE